MSADLRKSDLAAVWDQLEKIETLIDASPAPAAAASEAKAPEPQPEPLPDQVFGQWRDRRTKRAPYVKYDGGRRKTDRKAG